MSRINLPDLMDRGDFRAALNTMLAEIYLNPETLLVPTADITTTSTSAGDITGLLLTIEENSRYVIDGFITFDCNNTGGSKFGFVSPSGVDYRIMLYGLTSSATAYQRTFLTADGLTSAAYSTVNSSPAAAFVEVHGTITTGAGEGGTFKMQFASGTSTQTTKVWKEGSYLSIKKIS